MQVAREKIDGGWRFRDLPAVEWPTFSNLPWLPAQVPGHVHLDLLRQGVIPDPFRRMHERDVQWVDRAAWVYATTLHLDAARLSRRGEHGRHFLHFHGLDTAARVFVNDVLVGRAENMFVPHRFDVTDVLREGENELRIELDPALEVGQQRARAYLGDGTSERGRQGYFNFGPRAFVRKAQYMFGWDWGPELVSCGIWQPVELVTAPVAEIRDWHFRYDFAEEGRVRPRVEAVINRSDAAAPLRIRGLLGDPAEGWTSGPVEVPAGTGPIPVTLVWPERLVSRWDPESPECFRLELALEGDGGQPADSVQGEIGFRTVRLVQEPDSAGEGLRFRINGRDTFIKGANWIPDHSFPGAITDEQLRERLHQAKQAGFNMLRIWGGGLYETESFYRLCDELGLLVWQDFPFACSMYPDDEEWFVAAVREEAAAAIRRIRNHPSLALWCGGNENLQLAQQRWDREKQAQRFFGDRLIHEVLPELLRREDPDTPYWPNSPYGGPQANAETHGDSHYWDVWHGRGDWTYYRDSAARFSSEFGFASACGMGAWMRCTDPEDRAPRSPVAQWHDKTRKGYETYLGYVALHFPEPQSLEDLVYYSQLNQAEALQFGVEHWRRAKGHCWGTLIWQLNDCWPVQSWAMVDSEGEPKAAWYAARRFYAPLLLSLQKEDGTVSAHLVNDTDREVPGALTITLATFAGDRLGGAMVRAAAPANAAAEALSLTLAGAAGRETEAFVSARFEPDDGGPAAETLQLLAEPKDLALDAAGLSISVLELDGSAAVRLEARSFAPYVWLYHSDHTPLRDLEDNFFHLRPGESRTVRLGSSGIHSVSELRKMFRVRTLAGEYMADGQPLE